MNTITQQQLEEGVAAVTLVNAALVGTVMDWHLAASAWRHMSEDAQQELLRTYYAMRKLLH